MARQPLNAYLTRVLPGGALSMNPGGQLYIYEEGTTDEANVWDAKVGGDLHTQPLSADADGSFPGHWLEDDRDYDRVVVGDALNATQAWRVRKGSRYVIYPRDYGAAEDEETDETDALRDCIDDALTHDKDVTVAFRPITYYVDGDPVTDRNGNAILPVESGFASTNSVTLEGMGLGYNHPRRTILKTTRTTDTYDADLGPPSVLGGATLENGSGGWLFSGPVTIRGISVEVPNNPAVAGIDGQSFGGLVLDRSGVMGGNGEDATATPDNEWAFGVRLPGAFAFGLIDLRGFKARQMYAGMVLTKADHIVFGAGCGAQRCVLGIGFEESTSDGGPPLGGGYVQLDACKYLLAGWDPVTGVKSMGTTAVRRTISGLRIEAEPNVTGLFTEVASVLDANNKLIGRISLHRGASDLFSGAAQGTITGAANLDIYNPVNPNMATRRTAVPANVDLLTSQLVIFLDDSPGDVKVMFKAKDSSGTPVTGELAVSTTPGVETFEFSASLSATAAIAASFATVTPEPPVGAGLPASELYLWGGGGSAPTGVALDNTEMTWLDARGFKHIHMGIGRLRTFGGTQDFRSDGGAVTAAEYDYQEQIQNSDFVDRWHAYGADHKAYLQWDAPHTGDPPGAAITDWYNDTNWTNYCAKLQELAEYGTWQGFDGLSSDWEVFNNNNDAWHWDRWSTTDTHTEAQVRAKAFSRGAQMMTAILAGMPNADVYIYNVFEPGGWHESRSYWLRTHGTPGAQIKAEDWVQWDLYLGMASVSGYSVLRNNTAEFQKQVNPQEPASSALDWANAFRYSINHMGAMLSQDLSSDDWEYAYTRVKWMPFAWLDEIVGATSSSFSYKKSAAYVNTQLQAMREWGMGEMLPIFDHSGFNSANYVDHSGVSYNSAMEAAADDTVVDSTKPTLPVPTLGGSTITGTATDNYAMWAVKWEDNAGGSGMAECEYEILTDSSSEAAHPEWDILTDRFNWTIALADITPAATSVTITAVDSHMNESTPRVVSGI